MATPQQKQKVDGRARADSMYVSLSLIAPSNPTAKTFYADFSKWVTDQSIKASAEIQLIQSVKHYVDVASKPDAKQEFLNKYGGTEKIAYIISKANRIKTNISLMFVILLIILYQWYFRLGLSKNSDANQLLFGAAFTLILLSACGWGLYHIFLNWLVPEYGILQSVGIAF